MTAKVGSFNKKKKNKKRKEKAAARKPLPAQIFAQKKQVVCRRESFEYFKRNKCPTSFCTIVFHLFFLLRGVIFFVWDGPL